jgi:hypothetical protein
MRATCSASAWRPSSIRVDPRRRKQAPAGAGAQPSGGGYLAAAFVGAGRDAEAAAEFKAAIPVLLARRDDRDDAIATGAIVGQNRFIVERYMALLARNPALVGDAGAETFGLADGLRNRSVQRALAQASARWAAKDPAMGALARSEQDLRKQMADALESLNALLALPSAERDAKAVNETQQRIAKLRAQHSTAERDLARRFPAYANLLNPPPATPADIRAVTAPGSSSRTPRRRRIVLAAASGQPPWCVFDVGGYQVPRRAQSPPTMAVLPSADSPTEKPCPGFPTASAPTSSSIR